MHKGYLVELGDADEIYSNPKHTYTKSLLASIPQPSPRFEKNRVLETLDMYSLD